MPSSHDVRLADGRVLRVHDGGDPGGASALTLLWHHGSPQTGELLAPLVEAAAARDIRLVAYARPSYGGSSPNRGRTVASAADDVAQVVDALGIDRFAVMGASGGGPHALACAARLPERVVAAVTLGGIAPFTTDVDWYAGMVAPGGLRAAEAGRAARERYAETDEFDPNSFTAADWAALDGRVARAGRRRRSRGCRVARRPRRRRPGVRRAVGLRPGVDPGTGLARPRRRRSRDPAEPRRVAARPDRTPPSCGCARGTATCRSSTRCRSRWTGCSIGRERPDGQADAPAAGAARLDLPADLARLDDGLEARRDYEAVEVADRDLAGQSAQGATFTGCRIARCHLDGLDLRQSRVSDSLLVDNDATSVDASDATWRDSIVSGGRLGALIAAGATWTGVRLRGLKLDYLDLSGAKVSGVAFEEVVIGELELAEADLRSVRFELSAIEHLSASSARFTDVDLSGARLRTIAGIASLRGATISPEQLIDVAPLLAAHVGIVVKGD